MSVDYEVEYDNRARVPEHPDIQIRWRRLADAARGELNCTLGLSYGDRLRNRYDVVHPSARQDSDAPLIVFIHGGYWQRGDREDYTGVAGELSRRGVRVVLPSYTLCPDCGVGDIISEMQALCAKIWRRFARRPVVCGHSAGGHLAAALLATDWSVSEDLPHDLVPAAYAISGVFDLSPLVSTTVNGALRLTSESAVACSPILQAAPKPPKMLVAAVGADESSEFVRQSKDICAVWSEAGLTTECVIVPNANHFTVLDELTVPHSGMLNRLVEMAELRSRPG